MAASRNTTAVTEAAGHARIDKWLWAARFFKTRALAAEAVAGGRVHLNGTRAKPGKLVHIGDQVSVRRGPYDWVVIVRELTSIRGSAAQAALLYEETEESKEKREKLAEQIKAQGFHRLGPEGRPSKRDRRQIMRLIRGEEEFE